MSSKKVKLYFTRDCPTSTITYKAGNIYEIELLNEGSMDRWTRRGCILPEEAPERLKANEPVSEPEVVEPPKDDPPAEEPTVEEPEQESEEEEPTVEEPEKPAKQSPKNKRNNKRN